MAIFDTLAECLKFIQLKERLGEPVSEAVWAEKARLEERERIDENEFIFSTMKANNRFMSDEKEQCVREMVAELLKDGPEATQPCLLLGNVQCGKTDTFESIMGLAMDKGIDVCIVMTKGTNTLTEQTLKRLNNDFRFFAESGRIDQKIIVRIFDIMKLMHSRLGSWAEDPRNKFIIVCKKEKKNLEHLIKLFATESPELANRKVLIVDDEADFASRAYYEREGNTRLLRIGELIEQLISELHYYYRYLQVTATPYSLYLQPDGSIQLREGKEASPWLPRYTGLVPIHDKYIGGQQYYVESKNEESIYFHLYKEVSENCMGKLNERHDDYMTVRAHSENIRDLTKAIVGYLMATAIRSIQEERKGQIYKSSCLIHVEINKEYHRWQEEFISSIIEDVRESFADLFLLSIKQETYEDFLQSSQKGRASGLINVDFPSFEEVEARLRKLLQSQDYSINVVNSEEPGKVQTMLDDRGQLQLTRNANFFIGGSILDRGITIDNMLCFFYGRDPKMFQMDTVIQHARMYGARTKEDMAVTRFYTTERIYKVLEQMNAFDDYLRDYLKKHKDNIRTEDITSIVIGYDKRIKPSAQNKYKPSNTKVLKRNQRILPVGFQTGTYDEIYGTVAKIDKLIMGTEGFKADDYFLMDYETAVKIINLANETFKYGEEYENLDYRWDPNEMLSILDYLTYDTDGLIWCLQRTGRDVSRKRDNGKFIDAPDDGRTDRPGELAKDRPVLMLFKENGRQAQGWQNAPFYWPLLYTPDNTREGIFTINADKRRKAPKQPILLDHLADYPQDEILSLTLKTGPFMDIVFGIKKQEIREIKPTTKSLYLARDERGQYILEDGIPTDREYSIYDVVDDKFPFKLKNIKYLYFRCSRDQSGSKLLVKLNPEKPFELVPGATGETDIIYSHSGRGREKIFENRVDWLLLYNICEIIEYKLTPKDQDYYDTIVQEREEDEQRVQRARLEQQNNE